jgi:hypothetical protein
LGWSSFLSHSGIEPSLMWEKIRTRFDIDELVGSSRSV